MYTCIFFAAGIAVAIAAKTPDSLGVTRAAPAYATPSPGQLAQGLALTAAAVASTVAAGFAAHRSKSPWPGLAYEFTTGLLFALALGISEMTRPTVVRPPLPAPPPIHTHTIIHTTYAPPPAKIAATCPCISADPGTASPQ